MKEIVVESKTYGRQLILLDDEDFEELSRFNWSVRKNSRVFYATMVPWIIGVGAGKQVLMHRAVLGLTDSNILVDHIDHNGLNNQKNNLRICTNSENIRNTRKRTIVTTSKYKGVHWCTQKSKWRVKIHFNKRDPRWIL